MANRRCLLALTRQALPFLFTHPNPSFRSICLPHFPNSPLNPSASLPIFTRPTSAFAIWSHLRYSSSTNQSDYRKEGGEIKDDSDEELEDEERCDDENVSVSSGRVYTPEEKEAEALAIGYKVVGPLQKSDRVFKPYEPVFAVVEIGSHQFKVSNGDSIFTERLKFCEVNDKLILNKVLLLGSVSQTIVGRPVVPDAAVHAVIEEHALDAKVIIFKKKRRKNYRRTKGHRQELTKLRITDIQGIERPQNDSTEKPKAVMQHS